MLKKISLFLIPGILISMCTANALSDGTLSGVSQISATSLNGASINTSYVGMKTFSKKVIDKGGIES